MGKKVKTGKRRKDKFYHLAKETGYRARSAFKLIQLNRKFGFLEKSRCVIDLCAAPGGWLQVASKFMPVSSIIVGVDLVSIKPIRNVITLQADITTEKCKQLLRKELQTWKADCVLNDGAPNVGSAWIQDAFSQAHLTLSALRLACDFLREGGWFITKVFRSKDYQPLLWVFQQLFKKVHSTKPQASRNESAEIFVVCQGYIAPDKIDPKILDWKHIFKEVQPEGKRKPSILQPEKKKRAEGYEDGNYTLHKSAAVVDFINSEEPLEFLSSVNSLTFDDKRILRHPLTTEEIKESFNDLKVLGKADIRSILAWQRSIRKELNIKSKEEESNKNEEQEEENEEEMIQKTVQTMQEEEDREEKRKKKKAQVQRQKLKERMQLKMVLPGDTNEIIQEREIFALSHIKNKKELDKVEDVEADDISIENEEDSEMEDDNKYSNSGSDSSDAEEDQVEENEKESRIKDTNSSLHYRERNDEKNPLLVDFIPDEDAKTKTEMWFSKDVFKGLEDEEDEDVEINEMMNEFKKKGGVIIEKGSTENTENIERKKQEKKTKLKVQGVSNDNCNHEQKRESYDDDDDDSDDDNSEDESESDYDMEAINHPSQPSETKKSTKNKREDFEVVPAESNTSVLKKLSAEGLALGAQMAFSRKRRRDIIDNSYHRWTFNDEGLPEWFKEEEAKFYQKQLPVTKEQVDEYKARMREINARPIKKIAEAKAKKKAKALKRLEKARKKAEAICDAVDVTEREKMQQLKTLYKKAEVGKKRKAEPQYVVAKKSLAAKRMKRPAGVKGPYKIVDPRMKKDLRAKQAKDKTKGRGKKTKKGKR